MNHFPTPGQALVNVGQMELATFVRTDLPRVTVVNEEGFIGSVHQDQLVTLTSFVRLARDGEWGTDLQRLVSKYDADANEYLVARRTLRQYQQELARD